MAEHEGLSRRLSAGRRRLRVRAAWRGSAVGVLAGSIGAVVAVAVGRLGFSIDAIEALGLIAGLPLAGAIVGAGVAAWRWSLDARGLALVLDTIGGTQERLITALHLARGDPDDPRTVAALAELEAIDLDALPRRLPVRWPRSTALVPVVLALAGALVFLPAGLLADWVRTEAPRTALTEAGERLQDRLAEIEPPPEAPLWPEDVERRVEALAEEMKRGEINEAEAADQLDELAKGIEALEGSLEQAEDALDALEEAAEKLDAPATEALREALSSGSPQAAREAAEALQESMSGADPETRSRTAEAMRRAGEELARSGDPALSGAGQALQDAAEQAEAGGELSPEQIQQLSEQLEQARAAGRQMQQDAEALERAQRLAGAIEGARQQLGEGDPAGQSSQGPGDGPGEGAEGGGEGPGGGLGAGSRAGAEGHTWEDQGEAPPAGPGEGGAGDRTSDRSEGQHIDDFEKFYEAVRLEGARSLVAGTDSQLNEAGRVDELEYRLTTAEESASTGRVALPDGYRDAASAAIEAETIPPAYRNAVKDYFAEMQ